MLRDSMKNTYCNLCRYADTSSFVYVCVQELVFTAVCVYYNPITTPIPEPRSTQGGVRTKHDDICIYKPQTH